MILIIRGHIRNSFDTPNLYNLIKQIYDANNDLTIYIHTWTIFANNVSWRKIELNSNVVNEDIINDYFKDLKHLILKIIIDDDKEVKLIGNINGNINNGSIPLLGWKNYWYGKHKIIDYVANTVASNEPVINLRFDILNNSNSLNEEQIIMFIKKNGHMEHIKNVFIFEKEKNGVDNIYAGNVQTMHKLSDRFYNNLDEILTKNKDTVHAEYLVFRINNQLFN
jgi:hypothetical protein